ncbi:MAG TPA: arginase family protein, partial [Candidatus Limnocylindrales bacterium]|nr:arginase family protein [Candidatus Limnocylindrales bacterium]
IRRIVGQVDLAGMDIVEVSPPYDHAETTAMIANRAALEAISALALKRRDGRPIRYTGPGTGEGQPSPVVDATGRATNGDAPASG